MKKNDSIKPEPVKLDVRGPYKVFNPLDALPAAWFYRVGRKLEFCVRVPGPDGVYNYLFEVLAVPKKKRSQR